MIGRNLKDDVLDLPRVNDYYLFSGEELANHFEILLSPRPFSFELIEIWRPHSLWAEEGFIGRDREDARPKKDYSPLAGGYYAARLAVLEHLQRWGRQAGVLAVREISEDYSAPLGVWVVREVARKAMSSPPEPLIPSPPLAKRWPAGSSPLPARGSGRQRSSRLRPREGWMSSSRYCDAEWCA